MNFFHENIKKIFKLAAKNAIQNNSSKLTLSHLFLESLNNREIVNILEDCSINIGLLKEKIELDILEVSDSNTNIQNIKHTETVKYLIKICEDEYTKRHVFAKEKNLDTKKALIDEPTFLNILIMPTGDITNTDNEAHVIQHYLLTSSTFSQFSDVAIEISQYCSDMINKNYGNYQNDMISEDEDLNLGNSMIEQENNGNASMLDIYTKNLNKLYASGDLDCEVIERENEIRQVIKTLTRRKKANPLLIGESGVGKTSIANLLAKMIVDNEVPKALSNKIILSLDISKLVSGTKYRGDFEKRMNGVINELAANQNYVLFIDEIHMIIGAGAASGGSMDASNMLKGNLASGKIKAMGTTTLKEYKKYIKSDEAFDNRFQKIMVNEPDLATTKTILSMSIGNYESHHNIKYSDDVLSKIVQLSNRYLHEKSFPDKAFDLIDEIGALYSSGLQKGKNAKISDVISVVEEKSGIKIFTDKEEKKNLENLLPSLTKKIYGQPEACKSVVDAIYTAKSGLSNPEKPYASFLFLGPTGVGKTEIVKELANQMSMSLLRYDMSEYMEKHTVSKLFGAPPGYVGFEDGGQLTEEVRKNPYSIILLDEVEKAHPDVLNTLLQVLDNGILTDSQGVKTYFRNTIIVMTSNAGASTMEKAIYGFASESQQEDTSFKLDNKIVKKFFSPELRNRISKIVKFNYLDEESILKVVDKNLIEITERITSKGIDFKVTSSAKKWLAENGYDKFMGARPMERIINEEILSNVASKILFSNPKKINVKTKDKKIELEFI